MVVDEPPSEKPVVEDGERMPDVGDVLHAVERLAGGLGPVGPVALGADSVGAVQFCRSSSGMIQA